MVKKRKQTRSQTLRIDPPLKIKKINSLQWIFEPLEIRAEFIQKKMFGCEAAYLSDRIVLVIADKSEPWNGILLPTERAFQASIQNELSGLNPHPLLKKWLYLSQNTPHFEETALEIVKRILASDPRFGVNPKPKKSKRNRTY